MKTRKILSESFVVLFLILIPISVFGQSMPHTFSANTAAKASEVNENFEYLLERFGTRKTTVNCNNTESITTALKNYNHVVISGICSENLSLDATKLPHRVVILEGSSSSSDGISASDNSKAVIEIFNGGITLKATNLQFKNGTYGILAYRGATVVVESLIIKDNTLDGMFLGGTTYANIKNSTVQNNGSQGIGVYQTSMIAVRNTTISGHNSGNSLSIENNSSAYVNGSNIQNGKSGIEVRRTSAADIVNTTIQSAVNGLTVKDSASVKLDGNTIRNNSNHGIELNNNSSVTLYNDNSITGNTKDGIYLSNSSSLKSYCDSTSSNTTTISGNDGRAIGLGLNSSLFLCNATINSPKGGIYIIRGGNIDLKNSTITNSSDRGISSEGGIITMEDSTISGSTDAEIVAYFSHLVLDNTSISGTLGNTEIKLSKGSTLWLEDGSSVTGTIECDGSLGNNNTIDNGTSSVTSSGC